MSPEPKATQAGKAFFLGKGFGEENLHPANISNLEKRLRDIFVIEPI